MIDRQPESEIPDASEIVPGSRQCFFGGAPLVSILERNIALRPRVRKSRQKEAAGPADAGLMQIEWSEGEMLKLAESARKRKKEVRDYDEIFRWAIGAKSVAF
jgi:hypothetical protein